MTEICLEMPLVAKCVVSDCVYNINQGCHARAITVGDATHPECDTYMGAANHTSRKQLQAGVGACKVTGCNYNEDFECMASSINVGYRGSSVHCLTFVKRT
ncbi:MAG: DUF1540 domain-containing protein [Thiohalomonadaceae bacterium]